MGERKESDQERKDRLVKEEQDKVDMNFLLSDARGRRFLWRLIQDCEVFAVNMSANNADKFIHDGKRVIGNTVIGKMMRTKADSFHTMAAENASSFKPQ